MSDIEADWMERLSETNKAELWHCAFMKACDAREIPMLPSVWILDDTFCPNHTRLRYRIGMFPMSIVPEETRTAVLRLGEGVAETLGVELLAQIDDGKWFRFQVTNR